MTREYGDHCGLAHALDLVGSRWTLLIVRELLTGPKRFTDLEQGLPGIPTNILSARLRELEDSGLVERRLLPRPASGVAYDLTDYGRELEGPIISLGMWGVRSMGAPKSGDHFSCSALALGLRATYHPERARDTRLSFEIRWDGMRLRGSLEDGQLTVPAESIDEPDITIEADPAILSRLFYGMESVDAAIDAGTLQLSGSREQAQHFFDLFNMHAGTAASSQQPAASHS
jgi:DNA-binding HxlR family transcriptional regulator